MHVIAIFGPTGVGKTEIALELADLLRSRGEKPVAVSADAFQVYEGLDALVAHLEHHTPLQSSPTRTRALADALVGPARLAVV